MAGGVAQGRDAGPAVRARGVALAAAEPGLHSGRRRTSRRAEWFEEARFGLFVHWGVYSLLGEGEWVMNNEKIPIQEYEKLPARFNPRAFDAESRGGDGKAAGTKYITVTSKHHDGFCMFDAKLTRYDIVDATPYARTP